MTIDPAANTGSAECHASIVITGFSGTGKNTVGRIVARKLGREFVDLDEAIATREGKTVREIFETCGEAYFRDCEEMVCAELAEHLDLVIATGGGTLANPRNHDAFEQTWVVCLDASVDSIVARLKDAKDRPLLATGTLREGVENLLQARTPVYAQLGKHVDTTDKCPEQVAEEIVAAFPHQHRTTGETGNRAPVRSFPAGAHPILLGPGLLEQVGTWLEESSAGVFSTPCAIITNPRVRALYGDQVVTSLAANHFVPNVILIPEGEKYKTLQTASQVYDRLIDAQLDRRSAIFALGGGVVGDLAGFVAATLLRGVPLIHLPTTLLAIVDASIGGKVGVDHPRGKNLVGAFKLPQAVIVDIETLKTLPDAEFRAGLYEVVKHAIIGDVGLFGWLEKRAAAIRSGALETAYLVT